AAHAALQAVGLPEARIPMAEAVLYLASAPKSHTVVQSLQRLDAVLAQAPMANVPEFLRDRHGRRPLPAYHYPHDQADHFVPDSYWPEDVPFVPIFEPGGQGKEYEVAQRLQKWDALRRKAGHLSRLRRRVDQQRADASDQGEKSE
ncbi:MAG: hypothetical protein OWS74_02400, partial [Firmicutes bacterium]|nr:hypothetical protein [Bacillota bacterium]